MKIEFDTENVNAMVSIFKVLKVLHKIFINVGIGLVYLMVLGMVMSVLA